MVVVDGGDVPTLRRGHVIFLRTTLNTQAEESIVEQYVVLLVRKGRKKMFEMCTQDCDLEGCWCIDTSSLNLRNTFQYNMLLYNYIIHMTILQKDDQGITNA